MDMGWRIRVIFSDGYGPKEYISPDVRSSDPGWSSELFNRSIEFLEFYLPTRHKIVMRGMEKYNFFVEASQDLAQRMNVRIDAFWFLGKFPGKNLVYRWRVAPGSVTHDIAPWGKEWGGNATKGWKPGVPLKPVSFICDIG